MRQLKRIDSEAVQGKGSYVVVKALTWAERKRFNEARAAADFDSDAETERILSKYIVEWNWTDIDEEPLPAPDSPGIWDSLTIEEIEFLTEVLFENSKYQKN